VDGRIRRVPTEVAHLTTFPIAAAEAYVGHKITTPGNRAAWIDFPGPPYSVPYISFHNVETGHWDPNEVKGKLVVVGSWAASLQDLHLTSTTSSGLMPGPEIQAVAAWSAIDGFPLRSDTPWINTVLVIFFGAFVPLLALRVRRIGIAVLAGLLAI